MSHFTTTISATFESAIEQVKEALKREGMGVLTEIDVQAAFKKKLDKDFHRYTILGACQPTIAYEMLQADKYAGVFYPCNIVVQEIDSNRIEVSAVDPLAMFLTIHSPRAKEVALEAHDMMQLVIRHLEAMQPEPVAAR